MIDVINLKKSFGSHDVLNGIDININKGDIVVVIGPSGSGKSTFLRCLNCMEDPTGGQIIFNDVDIADPHVDINVHRRHMGMVFQHFNLFNNKTVLENIMLAPVHVRCKGLHGAKRKGEVKKIREQAMALLARINMQDKADVYPSTLSGDSRISSPEPYFLQRSICVSSSLLKLCTPTERRFTRPLSAESQGSTRWFGLVSQATSLMLKFSPAISMVRQSSSSKIVGVPPPKYRLSKS